MQEPIFMPTHINDLPPFFRKFHNELVKPFKNFSQDTKLSTTVSSMLRTAWTEHLMSEKNFFFFISNKVILINVLEKEVQAMEVPAVPFNLMLLLAAALEEGEEINFSDSCVRLSSLFSKL